MQGQHRRYAVTLLLSEFENKISALPPTQQRSWEKKRRTLQQQATPLLETPPPSTPLPFPDQQLPQQLTPAECALYRAHWSKKRTLTQGVRKRSAPVLAWIQSIPPSGNWATLALEKLSRTMAELEKKLALQTQRVQQVERQGTQIWQAFGEASTALDASAANMMHIFDTLQEKKQRLEHREAELFIKKYESAPVEALYTEIEHRLDLWEAELVQPEEHNRLEHEVSHGMKELTQWSASLALCRESIAKLRQTKLSNTQRALFYWMPLYLEKLEIFHATAQQAASLRMGIQLVRARAGAQLEAKKKESTPLLLKTCLRLWEQKSKRVEAAFRKIAKESIPLKENAQEEVLDAPSSQSLGIPSS